MGYAANRSQRVGQRSERIDSRTLRRTGCPVRTGVLGFRPSASVTASRTHVLSTFDIDIARVHREPVNRVPVGSGQVPNRFAFRLRTSDSQPRLPVHPYAIVHRGHPPQGRLASTRVTETTSVRDRRRHRGINIARPDPCSQYRFPWSRIGNSDGPCVDGRRPCEAERHLNWRNPFATIGPPRTRNRARWPRPGATTAMLRAGPMSGPPRDAGVATGKNRYDKSGKDVGFRHLRKNWKPALNPLH